MPRADTGWIELQVAEVNAAIGSFGWTNPANALTATSGDLPGAGITTPGISYAIAPQSPAGSITKYLVLRNPNFVFPVDARLLGLELNVLVMAVGSAIDYSVKLINNGVLFGNEKAVGQAWNFVCGGGYGCAQEVVYGGPTDTWGAQIHQNILNSNTFGFALSGKILTADDSIEILYVKSRFYYEYGGFLGI